MTTYRTVIDIPRAHADFFEKLREYAEVNFVANDQLELLFETGPECSAEDEYELALVVNDLENDINSNFGYDHVDIPRPRMVSE